MSTYEVLIILVSLFSLFISIIALLYSKKDRPSFMPHLNDYKRYLNRNIITLTWINASDKTISDLTILINFFNSNLDEIKIRKIEDKYNFGIVGKSIFNYSFDDVNDLRFFRVRFHGKYSNAFPFIKNNLNQHIWYTANPIKEKDLVVGYDFHTTYKDELKRIQDNNKQIFKEYENTIDKKFR